MVLHHNMAEKLNLRWDSFHSSLGTSLKNLRDKQEFCDVTLAADDDQVQAHKIIISAGSTFFEKILRNNVHAHPFVYLKGMKMSHLKDILTFMYLGQVEVSEVNLGEFLEVAKDLEILGLSTENQTGRDLMPMPQSPNVAEAQENFKLQGNSNQKEYSKLQGDSKLQKNYMLKENKELQPRQIEEVFHPIKYESPNEIFLQQNIIEIENYEGNDQEYLAEEHLDEDIIEDNELKPISVLGTNERTNLFTQENSEGRLKCDLCEKSYKNKSDLRNHVQNHTNAFSFSCDLCDGKVYKSKNSLRMHINNFHK